MNRVALLLFTLVVAGPFTVVRADDYQSVANAFGRFLNSPIYLSLSNPSCRYSQRPLTEIHDTEVCSLKTPAEFLGWTYGFNENCRGNDAEKVIEEIADQLAQTSKERCDIYTILSAASPDTRRSVCEDHVSVMSGSVSKAKIEWLRSERYLDSLRRYAETQSSITSQERATLHSYFQNGYIRINGVLRSGGQTAKCFEPFSNSLLALLKKLPVFAGTVWRGASASETTLKKYQSGAEISWSEFVSTTVDRKVAESFAQTGPSGQGIVFKIFSKSCVDVRGVSDKLNEQEVLCLPGMRVRMIWSEPPNVIALEEVL